MREIVFDTETTGFEPSEGHRLVEIGAIETIDRIPTGKVYHVYINPERSIPEDAIKVHGITNEIMNEKGEPILKVLKEFRKDFQSCHIL